MHREELTELLTPESLTLLDSLPPYESERDVVQMVTRLRRQGVPPGVTASVLTQSKLRSRGRVKFGEFASSMLFTESGLEQATRLSVAAHHAGRFSQAGITRVADLGCGIGGDAMALASLGINVTAVDNDEVTAAIASFNLAPFPNASVLHADAETVPLDSVDGVFFDPARRTPGHTDTHRHANPAHFTPSLDLVFSTAAKLPTGVKLGPGTDRTLIPHNAEAQWVSVDGTVVEMSLWFGELSREDVRRSALIIDERGAAELNAPTDSEDAPIGHLGRYLYEPDGSVIRARLIGALARELSGHMISDSIAYITSDALIATRFAKTFRVLEQHRFDRNTLAALLRQRGVGTLEIKKRGVDVDPATLRKELALRGSESATIIITRVASEHTVLFVERTSA